MTIIIFCRWVIVKPGSRASGDAAQLVLANTLSGDLNLATSGGRRDFGALSLRLRVAAHRSWSGKNVAFGRHVEHWQALKEYVLEMNAQSEGNLGVALDSELPREHDIGSFGPRRMNQTMVHRLGWLAAALICTAYIASLFSLTSFPFQDYPNHLARGAVMADLLFENGARFGHSYDVALSPVPYVLHDLVLAGCIELFGIKTGGALFAALVFMSLPLALLFYLHVTQLAPRAKLFVFLISLYLSADGFFLMAFIGFRLALAEIIVSLALAEMLRRHWSRG
jgi:hypothetical protein